LHKAFKLIIINENNLSFCEQALIRGSLSLIQDKIFYAYLLNKILFFHPD